MCYIYLHPPHSKMLYNGDKLWEVFKACVEYCLLDKDHRTKLVLLCSTEIEVELSTVI